MSPGRKEGLAVLKLICMCVYIHAHSYSTAVANLKVLQSSDFFSKAKEIIRALIKFEGSIKWEYNSQKW